MKVATNDPALNNMTPLVLIHGYRNVLIMLAFLQPACLHLTKTPAQLFSQLLDMVSSTAYMCARNDMQLYVFLSSRFTPPHAAKGLFVGPNQRDLARIKVIVVTRNDPVK